jgi:hypothetical protein
MARRRAWQDLARVTKERIERRVRRSAVRIMNDLAEAGPNWSGVFRDSWEAVPEVSATGGAFTGYPYNGSSVPRLTLNDQDLRSPTIVAYSIVNATDYAPIAMDLEPGDFWAKDQPKGDIVLKGVREDDQIRGHIDTSEPGSNRATAERDWYRTYCEGGGLEKAMREDRDVPGISVPSYR